jgi:hypothetical protein
MDPRRFDSLAKSLAAPRSRRGVLGSIAALAAGLIGARSAGAEVSQAFCGNSTCAGNAGICKPGCVCCTYSNGNSRCMPPSRCTGTIECPNAADLCGGVCCPTNQFCVADACVACLPNGTGCDSDTECCSGVCDVYAGQCAPCPGAADPCGVAETCCTVGQYCNGETCLTCHADEAACDSDIECCSGLCDIYTRLCLSPF